MMLVVLPLSWSSKFRWSPNFNVIVKHKNIFMDLEEQQLIPNLKCTKLVNYTFFFCTPILYRVIQSHVAE